MNSELVILSMHEDIAQARVSVRKAVLQNHNLEGIAGNDVINYISTLVELRRFLCKL